MPGRPAKCRRRFSSTPAPSDTTPQNCAADATGRARRLRLLPGGRPRVAELRGCRPGGSVAAARGIDPRRRWRQLPGGLGRGVTRCHAGALGGGSGSPPPARVIAFGTSSSPPALVAAAPDPVERPVLATPSVAEAAVLRTARARLRATVEPVGETAGFLLRTPCPSGPGRPPRRLA